MENRYYIAIGLLLTAVVLTFLVPMWMENKEQKDWEKRNGK